ITARQRIGLKESADSPALIVTIDSVAPPVPGRPDLTFQSDSGMSDTDDITNVMSPRLAVLGSYAFEVFRDGVQISPDYVPGSYFTVPALVDGTYAFSAAHVDFAGNRSDIGP